MNPYVLHEDNHCVAVFKPAGMPTQGDESGKMSVVDWVREDLRVRHQKPGNVFVGLVHRLDQPVSGVVLLGRTSKGAARLSEQFREGNVKKVYWVIVEGKIEEAEGEWDDWLAKDAKENFVRVAQPGEPGAKEASLGYRTLDTLAGGRTWLEVEPRTGRGHQIRVQLASRGFPIVGDRKYGAVTSARAEDGGFRIALHARELTFRHPTREEAIEVSAPLPPDWPGPSSVG
jgi:23S rRNA pseudouridine1911/1915/1917 synthase